MLWIGLAAMMAAIGADRASKALVWSGGTLPTGNADAILVRLPKGLSLCVWTALLVVGSAVVVAEADPAASIGLGLAVGGAASNLIDVFRHGIVLDNIRLPGVMLFNLADAALVAGTLMAVWRILA